MWRAQTSTTEPTFKSNFVFRIVFFIKPQTEHFVKALTCTRNESQIRQFVKALMRTGN